MTTDPVALLEEEKSRLIRKANPTPKDMRLIFAYDAAIALMRAPVGDALDQALTDPENQPSQWGTIPVSFIPDRVEVPHQNGPMDSAEDYEEWEAVGYARGWNACIDAAMQQTTKEGGE